MLRSGITNDGEFASLVFITNNNYNQVHIQKACKAEKLPANRKEYERNMICIIA
jgi:hypothetical protein